MKLSFKDIINKENDKIAIVAGLGPSLTKHLDNIKKIRDSDKYIVISSGFVDEFTDLNIDYWCAANTDLRIDIMYERFNKMNAVLVYADSIDFTPQKEIDKLLTVDYLPYDQRHHLDSVNCAYKLLYKNTCSCSNKTNRLSLQEELKKYTNHTEPRLSEYLNFNAAESLYAAGGGTVAIPMLCLAVLLGCKNIFVSGVDLDYSGGYVNNHPTDNINFTNKEVSLIQFCVKTIYDSANKIGTKIRCMDYGTPISNILGVESIK